ncbi:MAG TPA: UDP-glucose/GDP-mannose dehydrogenase family protein [Gaiellaceae bacterium]
MSRVAVFGAGYVGLVTGACFADLGHDVVVRDIQPERIERLRAGEVPIYEPGLEELLRRNAERLTFTLDVADAVTGADFLYVAVGTPPTYSGDADLSAVWTVVDELDGVEGRPIMVMKSTVPVGTGARVRNRLDERGLEHVGYVSNPEFTAEGTAVRDFQHPDRIVIGAFDDAHGDAVERLHEGIDGPVVRSDVASAEMIKLAANAALMTRISFINEIANVCEATGADVVRVAEGVGLDRRIGPSFLRAGIGYGGSCFPKDSLALKQLAANSGYHFQLLNAVIEVNELQKRRVIGKLQNHLGTLRGKTVALLGLAFKPGTDDVREAPSLVLAGRLAAEGAEVRVWDPVVDGADVLPRVTVGADPLDALAGADAAVLVTEWPQLGELDWGEAARRMRTALLIDGRNMLDPAAMAAAGFTYEGIGRNHS